MTIDDHIAQASEWGAGITVHDDSRGWRVTCMALADEVKRLRSELSFFANLNSYVIPSEFLANKALKALKP